MNLLPFLVLTLGLFWVLLVWAARHNRVHRPPRAPVEVRFKLDPEQLRRALAAASISVAEFGDSMRRLQAAAAAAAPTVHELSKKIRAASQRLTRIEKP